MKCRTQLAFKPEHEFGDGEFCRARAKHVQRAFERKFNVEWNVETIPIAKDYATKVGTHFKGSGSNDDESLIKNLLDF